MDFASSCLSAINARLAKSCDDDTDIIGEIHSPINQFENKLSRITILQAPYLIIAFAYSNVRSGTQESIQDIRGAFFMIVCEIVFSCSYGTLQFYPSQMPLLRRETNEHIYKFSAFYIAETLWQFQATAIRSIALVTLTYLTFGFFKGIKLYFQFAFTVVLTTFTSNSYGFLLTGLFDTGREMAPLFSLIFQILAGFFINLHSFPYVRYISVFFYANEAMTILYWFDVTDIGKYKSRFISLPPSSNEAHFITCRVPTGFE